MEYSTTKKNFNPIPIDGLHVDDVKESEQPDTNVGEPSETGTPEPNKVNDMGEAIVFSIATPFTISEFTTSYPLSYEPNTPPIHVKLYQTNPRKSSGKFYCRTFTDSLESYERAVKKEYILLMRNFMHTQKFPDFHIMVNIYRPMAIKEFSRIRGKVFGILKESGIRAYYVHEPSEKSWIHIHALVNFDGTKEVLRKKVKEEFVRTGLEYGRDFRFKLKAVNPTYTDYKRLCSYILKFNGQRIEPRIPLLFLKNLGLRKAGCIGCWFVKGKGKLWEEFRKERMRKCIGQIEQDTTSVASYPVLTQYDGNATDEIE